MMVAINRTCGTVISGALFVSLLVSGNNISTVAANCLADNNAGIIRSSMAKVCKTYTLKKGISYSLKGYTMYEAIDSGIGSVIMNEEKIYNLRKLDQIARLEDGWNGKKARAFEEQFISKVRRIITALELQPELFPTACDSVQFEYEKEDGSYLEIEINSKNTWEVFQVNSEGREVYFSIADNIEAIIKVVNRFYG